MKATAHLSPLGAAEIPSGYLARLWVPAPGAHESWRTSDWWLTDVESVEEVIHWVRTRSEGSPSEVFVAGDDGTLLHLWGAKPDDASQIVTITLTR
ncbi:MAG: hypothetical protein L0G94_19515 [Brachybacterium sp.]|uniref:hypothetical protein n=1 Tax=Brachybacterium sp. TaxID=1891286 RepID=UPI002648D508|nr:hypothetical protein [Brachybacterium sp.]MDN5688845.1 hypothetical protein [Brachybacterium sp.]